MKDPISKKWKYKTKEARLILQSGIYYTLYRDKCFTGKYTTRKIHKNYIRAPSGLFSMFIDDVILVISLYYFIDVILSIK